MSAVTDKVAIHISHRAQIIIAQIINLRGASAASERSAEGKACVNSRPLPVTRAAVRNERLAQTSLSSETRI